MVDKCQPDGNAGVNMTLLLGKMTKSTMSEKDLKKASSRFTPSIGFVKYRRTIPIISLIQVDPEAVECSEEEIKLLLDPDNSNPKIDMVTYYASSHHKTHVQFTASKSKVDNDNYFIFQIKEQFVSLDKHFDRITMQASKKRYDVLNMFGGIPRDGEPVLIAKSKANMSIKELSSEIVKFGFSNKDFMKDLYNKAALPPEDPPKDPPKDPPEDPPEDPPKHPPKHPPKKLTEHWEVDGEKMFAYGTTTAVVVGAVGTAAAVAATPVLAVASGLAAAGYAAVTTFRTFFR